MKKWLLYIMSFAFSIGFFSCTAAEEAIITPDNESGEVLVSFKLNMPSSRDISSLDDNYPWERYIDPTDVHVFVFANDKYQEKITYLFWGNEEDGNETRTIQGRIQSAYQGQKIELVILTNIKNRATAEPKLTTGKTTKTDLYKELIFQYGTEAWTFSEKVKNYIPMWGISTPISIEADKMNDAGIINMYRAIAKIDIKINEGNGIENFKIKKLELHNVPDKGYCASLKTPNPDNNIQFEEASLPDDIKASKIFEVFSSETGEEKAIENKIYIPETGKYKPYPYFKIQIYAEVNHKERTYDLYMRENQVDKLSSFEIIRNHKYMINIKTITSTEEIKMVYNVNSWGQGTNVDIPFN